MHALRAALLLLGLFATAIHAADPPHIKVHRMLAAPAKDPATGWYPAVSTEGSVSALFPVPFNDVTATPDDPKAGKMVMYDLGAKSPEGIKFTVAEILESPGMPKIDPAKEPNPAQHPNDQISQVDHSDYAGFPSVSYAIVGPKSGAFTRIVMAPGRRILMILEYPPDQKEKATGFSKTFLSSLKIKKAESAK